MANVATAHGWKLDTTGTIVAASASAEVSPISITFVHYAGGTTAGHTAVLTDGNDNHICTLSCSGNGTPDHIDFSRVPLSHRTYNGLKLATLGSGVLTVQRG